MSLGYCAMWSHFVCTIQLNPVKDNIIESIFCRTHSAVVGWMGKKCNEMTTKMEYTRKGQRKDCECTFLHSNVKSKATIGSDTVRRRSAVDYTCHHCSTFEFSSARRHHIWHIWSQCLTHADCLLLIRITFGFSLLLKGRREKNSYKNKLENKWKDKQITSHWFQTNICT